MQPKFLKWSNPLTVDVNGFVDLDELRNHLGLFGNDDEDELLEELTMQAVFKVRDITGHSPVRSFVNAYYPQWSERFELAKYARNVEEVEIRYFASDSLLSDYDGEFRIDESGPVAAVNVRESVDVDQGVYANPVVVRFEYIPDDDFVHNARKAAWHIIGQEFHNRGADVSRVDFDGPAFKALTAYRPLV